MSKNYIVIGDVHGNLSLLKQLIEKLPKEAELVFVGDLIDRGPDSVETVNFIMENGYKCVRGNHEESMLRAYRDKMDMELWLSSDGKNTREQYKVAGEKTLRKHLKFFKSLPLYIELDAYDENGRQLLVTHAPVLDCIKDSAICKIDIEDYMWTRGLPRVGDDDYFNVFGHNIISRAIKNKAGFTKPNFDKSTLVKGAVINNQLGYAGIDTDACKNQLTAISFPEKKIYKVKV